MKKENPITNCVRMMAFFAVVLTILLDDAHGRSGRLAGRYSYSVIFPIEDRGAGVLRGEINAQ